MVLRHYRYGLGALLRYLLVFLQGLLHPLVNIFSGIGLEALNNQRLHLVRELFESSTNRHFGNCVVIPLGHYNSGLLGIFGHYQLVYCHTSP